MTEKEIEEKIDSLKKIPIFSSMEKRHLSGIAKKLMVRSFREGDVIIGKGKESSAFYIIWEGEADVYVDKERKSLKKGDYFGEVALLKETEATATVVAKTDITLLVLHREEFYEVLKENPKMQEYLEFRVEFGTYKF
jgi:CRP-like cAMP-binding protein